MSILFNLVASRILIQKLAKKGSTEYTGHGQPADSCHVSLRSNPGCHLHPMEKLHVRGLDHLQSVLDHFKNPTYTLGQYNISHGANNQNELL